MSRDGIQDESPNFRPLNRFIFLHEPQKAAEGQLIILATWLSGAAKHVAKYTSFYKRLVPNAKILLIKGPIDSYLWSYPIQRRNIRPAIAPIAEVLKSCGYGNNDEYNAARPSTSPHILMHIFSSGGANNISQLLQVWKSEMGIPLPLSGLIIDSAPAAGGCKQNYRGFYQTIPNGLFFRIFGTIAVSYLLLVLETSIALGRYPRPETTIRETILDETLLQVYEHDETSHIKQNRDGTTLAKAKRICYFASKADQNTPFQDIISHAEEAKRRGWNVDLHLWDDTQHCNHLGKYEQEYTEAVWNMWMPSKAKL